jgi:hypothetical protein
LYLGQLFSGESLEVHQFVPRGVQAVLLPVIHDSVGNILRDSGKLREDVRRRCVQVNSVCHGAQLERPPSRFVCQSSKRTQKCSSPYGHCPRHSDSFAAGVGYLAILPPTADRIIMNQQYSVWIYISCLLAILFTALVAIKLSRSPYIYGYIPSYMESMKTNELATDIRRIGCHRAVSEYVDLRQSCHKIWPRDSCERPYPYTSMSKTKGLWKDTLSSQGLTRCSQDSTTSTYSQDFRRKFPFWLVVRVVYQVQKRPHLRKLSKSKMGDSSPYFQHSNFSGETPHFSKIYIFCVISGLARKGSAAGLDNGRHPPVIYEARVRGGLNR